MRFWTFAPLLLITLTQVAQAATAPAKVIGTPTAPALYATKRIPWARADISALAEHVADHEIEAVRAKFIPTRRTYADLDTRSWIQGAFLSGMTEIADRSANPKYKAFVLGELKAANYTIDRTNYEGNDHLIAQTYAWAYRHGVGDAAIKPTLARFDGVLANPPQTPILWPAVSDDPQFREPGARYSWIDAYYMSPSAWIDMSNITKDQKYTRYALSEFWASHALLWDPSESLYFRDDRFIKQRDYKGRKIFWSRGNAWVLAGFANMLRRLPADDQDRPKLITLFKAMAEKLKAIQKPNGTWSTSLLDDAATAVPETSGTAFYTYAMAWGIKAGILDRAAYEPTVRRGWAALVRNVHPDGKVGFVQQVGDGPENCTYDDTQFYGSGAFMLAAVAVADLELAPGAPFAAKLTIQNGASTAQAAAPVSIPAERVLGASEPPASLSVLADGRVYPAQFVPARDGLPATIQTVLSLRAHQRVVVSIVPEIAPVTPHVQAFINQHVGGTLEPTGYKGGTLALVEAIDLPGGKSGYLTTIDGLGWESDRIGYRYYLDERSAVDVFGKKTPGLVLHRIGLRGDDYHVPAPWGQDVLRVADTVGLGGIGLVHGDRLEQLGRGRISARVTTGPVSATAEIVSGGFGDSSATLTTRYTIHQGSDLTFAEAHLVGTSAPLATGFPKTAGVSYVHSAGKEPWAYIGSWGVQGEAGDSLGIVLFYRKADIEGEWRDDGRNQYVVFKDPRAMSYAFAATWVQGPTGVKDVASFKSFADVALDGLNHPAVVAD